MQLYACDYRTAQRIVRARVGRPPAAVARAGAARYPGASRDVEQLSPPRAAHDAGQAATVEPQVQRLAATRTGRRVRAGDLGHRRAYAAPRDRRRARAQSPMHSSPSPPNAAAEAGVRRSPTTVIVHLSEDEPPFIEGAGAISVETAERLCCDARRLTIKPHGGDLVHSRITRCASYPQKRALYKRSKALPVPRLHRQPRTRGPPHRPRRPRRQSRAREHDPALPPPPHTAPRQPHRRQRVRREPRLHRRQPTRHHRQPATRTTPLTAARRRPAEGQSGLVSPG